MDRDQILQLLGQFLDENGLFFTFKDWAEHQGYSMNDFDMPEN